jgi:acetolactate synthase-1/2/3 large subunit
LEAEIRKLAETHKIPVVLTPMAKGMLAEDHPCYAGVVFHALSNIVGETHQEADLVVAAGYDPVEFNYESWMPKTAKLISFDVSRRISIGRCMMSPSMPSATSRRP